MTLKTTHPTYAIYRMHDPKYLYNAYDWFTSQVFCDGWGEFVERFGRSELFDDKIDTKKYLENEFGIEL